MFHWFLIHALLFGLVSADKQKVSVKGSLKCRNFDSRGVWIELWEKDTGGFWSKFTKWFDSDDFLDSTTSKEDGTFKISGSTKERTKIEPYMLIKHHCNVPKGCTRISRYDIPESYINGQDYNMEIVRLEDLTDKDKVVCQKF